VSDAAGRNQVIKVHVMMVGALPEAAYIHPRDAINAQSGKAAELTGPESNIVLVPLIGEIDGGTHKQSSPEMSSLASQVLARTQGPDSIDGTTVSDIRGEFDESETDLAWLIRSIRSLAASVLSQDEDSSL
jgi:hypothetical protein